MNRGFWTASVWLILIGLSLLIAGIILKIIDKEKQSYKGRARARVVDLLRKEEDGKYRSRYYPIIEYYAEGMLYKVVYPYGSYPSRWDIGKELIVFYEPHDPEKYQISEITARLYLPEILQGAGVFLLVLGVLSFIRFASRY